MWKNTQFGCSFLKQSAEGGNRLQLVVVCKQRPLLAAIGNSLEDIPTISLCRVDDLISICNFYCLSSTDYVVLEDNNPLSKALEDKRLPENLFRTLPADNHGTTSNLL